MRYNNYMEAEQTLLKRIQNDDKFSMRKILAALELGAISSMKSTGIID